MTYSEFNKIYFIEADRILTNYGFWRNNNQYILQNNTEFFIIHKNTVRADFIGFTFVFYHTFMNDLNNEPPKK